MATIEESIEVEVPVSTAYGQWTQFEKFPRFMDGVESVQRLDEKRLHWVAEIAGQKREWDAEITHQEADRRVAWRAVDQEGPDGVVTFQSLDAGRTRVVVGMTYEPEGIVESVGSMVGSDGRQVKKDLEAFKELIENGSLSDADHAARSAN